MTKKSVRSVIKKKARSIQKQGKRIDRKFDIEAIHEFRVTVKSLRSFLRLLRMNAHQPGLKFPHKFKRLYHIAGSIRDVQLEIEVLNKKQPEFHHYIDHLNKILDRRKNEWKRHYTKHTLQKLEKKLMRLDYEDLAEESLAHFIQSNVTVIKTISGMRIATDIQIHEVRKKIKDFLYIADVCSEKWKDVNRLWEKVPHEKYEDHARLIGSYHDERIRLKRLASFSSGAMTQNEKKIIAAYCDDEAGRLSHVRKNILQKTKKLFTGN